MPSNIHHPGKNKSFFNKLMAFYLFFSPINRVSAASFPNSLDAKGLDPVISFLSTHTVLSILVFIKFAPRDLSCSLKPYGIYLVDIQS